MESSHLKSRSHLLKKTQIGVECCDHVRNVIQVFVSKGSAEFPRTPSDIPGDDPQGSLLADPGFKRKELEPRETKTDAEANRG